MLGLYRDLFSCYSSIPVVEAVRVLDGDRRLGLYLVLYCELLSSQVSTDGRARS